MEVVNSSGVTGRAQALVATIPQMLAEIPDRVDPADNRMRDAVDGAQLALTDKATWVFMALGPYSFIEISRNAVEVLYSFSAGHIGYYEKLFAGRENLSGEFDTEDDPELAAFDKAIEWVHAEAVGTSVSDLPLELPAPDPDAPLESFEEKAFNIAYYAIHFHLLHELAHLYVFEGRELSDEERFAEEIDCDRLAVRWMKNMTPRDERDLRRIRAGIAFGLAYVAAQSVDRNSHDGLTHPKSYDRLINVLGEFFDPEDDAWAYPFAILTAHMTEKDLLPLPEGVQPEDGFPTFFDGARCYQEVIRASDPG